MKWWLILTVILPNAPEDDPARHQIQEWPMESQVACERALADTEQFIEREVVRMNINAEDLEYSVVCEER